MGSIHERIKAKAHRLHTVNVDARIMPAVQGMAAGQLTDTAKRMSVFMQELDRVRADRSLGMMDRHDLMQRLAADARDLGLKGRWNLLCNRTQCLGANATWYNRGSYAFYCEDCAHMLNHENLRSAEEFLGVGQKLCIEVATGAQAENLHVLP